MKIHKWAPLALVVPLFLAGCKGFWTAPAGTTTTTPTTTASSGNFYVLNVATSQLVGYYVNAGVLTQLPGSPYTLLATPLSLAISPNNSFLYVSTISGIFFYTISSNGQLTLGNSGNPISADQALSMQVDATNSWIVDVASGGSQAFAIPISPTTGLVTQTAEQYVALHASTLQQVAISPANTAVFVAMGAGGTAVIPFNAANANPFGVVSAIAVKNIAGAALSVAVDPSSRLLYVGETAATSGSNTGGLRAIDLSTFKEISGSPFASGGLAPYDILPVQSGGFVYVVNRQVSGSSTGQIAGFSVTGTSGAYSLTALTSTFAVGTNPVALAEDRTATFVFAVDYGGNPDLMGYTFDATTAGVLDSAVSAATGTDPVQASAIATLH
jgi:hypothetical protein